MDVPKRQEWTGLLDNHVLNFLRHEIIILDHKTVGIFVMKTLKSR